jgi:hypothetical protein
MRQHGGDGALAYAAEKQTGGKMVSNGLKPRVSIISLFAARIGLQFPVTTNADPCSLIQGNLM